MTHAAVEEDPIVEATTPSEERSEVMPRALRAVGALLLVIAASSFMFRDWGQLDDVTRYLTLLGQLVLLAAAGFFCGLKLKEKRGARTFLSLVVAIVPVHFAVLGGVLYSQLALDAPISELPAFAVWRAADAATAIGLMLGAQLVLMPATFIAMLTLARRHAWQLSLAFVGLNVVLLVPVREPDVIAAIVAVCAPLVLLLQLRLLARTPSLTTPQGRFARAMLAVPLIVIVGRTLLYYPITGPFLGVLILTLGLAAFAVSSHLDGGFEQRRFGVGRWSGVFAMILGWMITVGRGPLEHVLGQGLEPLDLPLLFIPAAVIVLGASELTSGGKLGLRRLGAALATLGVCLDVLSVNELLTSLVSLAVGIALVGYGARVRQKAVLALGSVSIGVGAVSAGWLTMNIEMLTHWGTLTAIGVALIFGAAALDRNRQDLQRRLFNFTTRMRAWSF